jgi:hypothetical protein
MYMYGISADALYNVVEPLLRSFSPPAGSFVVRRHGEPGAEEVRVDL